MFLKQSFRDFHCDAFVFLGDGDDEIFMQGNHYRIVDFQADISGEFIEACDDAFFCAVFIQQLEADKLFNCQHLLPVWPEALSSIKISFPTSSWA